MLLMLIYGCIFYICSFWFVCLLVCVNKMLFIIHALYYNKCQVHFLSFIDKTMHKSLDYICGFSRVSQSSRNIAHGFFGTSVYQKKYTVVSAYGGSLLLYPDCIVSPTRKVHVSPYKGWSSCGVVILSSRIGINV